MTTDIEEVIAHADFFSEQDILPQGGNKLFRLIPRSDVVIYPEGVVQGRDIDITSGCSRERLDHQNDARRGRRPSALRESSKFGDGHVVFRPWLHICDDVPGTRLVDTLHYDA